MKRICILISCDVGEENLIYSQLTAIPKIKDCVITYGRCDIFAKFEIDSKK